MSSFPSSYIKTVAGSVTRNADDLTAAQTISGTTGTMIATVKSLAASVSGVNDYVLDIGALNSPTAYRQGVSGVLAAYDGSAERLGPTWNDTASHKIGSRWNGSNFGLVIDGGALVKPVFDGDMNATTSISIGQRVTNTNAFSGHIKNLRIWNTALSDARMQGLTS